MSAPFGDEAGDTRTWLANAFDVSEEDAALYLRVEGERVLADRGEVGRWLADLRRRHGDVRHVDALHGASYRALTAVQAPFQETVFEAVFAAAGFTHIKRPVLYALYRELCRTHNNGYGTLKNRTLYAALDVWSKRRGVPVVSRNVKWPKHRWEDAPETTADVLVLAGSAADEPRLDTPTWRRTARRDGSVSAWRCRDGVTRRGMGASRRRHPHLHPDQAARRGRRPCVVRRELPGGLIPASYRLAIFPGRRQPSPAKRAADHPAGWTGGGCARTPRRVCSPRQRARQVVEGCASLSSFFAVSPSRAAAIARRRVRAVLAARGRQRAVSRGSFVRSLPPAASSEAAAALRVSAKTIQRPSRVWSPPLHRGSAGPHTGGRRAALDRGVLMPRPNAGPRLKPKQGRGLRNPLDRAGVRRS